MDDQHTFPRSPNFARLFLAVLATSLASMAALPRARWHELSVKGEADRRFRIVLPSPALTTEQAPDGRLYSRVKLADAARAGTVGLPDLPVIVRDLPLPPRGEVSTRLEGKGVTAVRTPHWVMPLQESVVKLPGARRRRRFIMNKAWYGKSKVSDTPYRPAMEQRIYVRRGQRFVRVFLHPYEYDPQSKRLRYAARMSLTVSVAPPRLPKAAGPRRGRVEILALPWRDEARREALLSLGLDIKTLRGGKAIVYATAAEKQAIEDLGIAVEVLGEQTPGAAAASKDLSGYHSFESILSLLSGYVADYPSLCRLQTLGYSTEGRQIVALKITDNPDREEDEPEIRFTAAIHGDEVVSTEMCLRWIDTLLSGYDGDARLRSLVDENELWVVPVVNPDGFVHGTRYNASGYDLNRSFPDGAEESIGTLFEGPPMDTAGRPPETVALMQWSAAHNFILAATFHSGSLVANYPYDNDGHGSSFSPTEDQDVFLWLAESYASHNPAMWNSTEFTNGITNGAAWYSITGGMQDWLYRYTGCMALTMELSYQDHPSADTLPDYWANNREAMLSYVETVRTAVRGLVTDAADGTPVYARIDIAGRAAPVYTDADVGDYCRLLRPGTYTVTVSAPGYQPRTFADIEVAENEQTRLDVSLSKTDPQPPAEQNRDIIVVHHADDDAAFAAYRAQKEKEAYTVTEIRLTGSPEATAVRDQVRAAYAATAARYVVLLGDMEEVPTFTNSVRGTVAHSDLLYALLDPGEDFEDFLGKDVYLGRVSLDTDGELRDYVGKLGAYVAGPRHRHLTWISGGATSSENDTAEGTHNAVLENYIDQDTFENTLYYRNNGSAEELNATIDAGTDAVVYSGHGQVDGWMRFGYDEAQLSQLTNVRDAPIVFGHCCLSGSFEVDDCFAEEWLLNTTRGVAYIGASDNTFWDEDDILEKREFRFMAEHSGSTLGEALDEALRQTAAVYPETAEYYFTIYHLFGDPTLRLFPIPLSIQHTPLTDTADNTGPYQVEAEVASDEAITEVSLHWRNDPELPFTVLPMTAAKSTRYVASLPGQPYGTNVEYFIRARNAGGAECTSPLQAPETLHRFTVGLVMTHEPLANTADTAGPYTVTIQLDSDVPPAADLHWRAGNGAYTTVPMTRQDAGVYSAAIPGQPAGSRISYYIVASVDEQTITEPRNAPTDTHTFRIDTAPPEFAGVDAAFPGDGQVTLSWEAAGEDTPPVTYLIYRSEESGGEDFAVVLGTTTETSYVDSEVTNGETYYYIVRAEDALGNREANTVEASAMPLGPQLVFDWPLDEDPGWQREGAWEFGEPQGLGGESYGNPDPDSAASGTRIFGYNLAGNYTNSMKAAYLTTGTIDCSNLSGTHLRFQRWLNVEQPQFDGASVEVSRDGHSWVVVWQNRSEITDASWQAQDIDISAVADGSATVRIRWGMGPTDASWEFSGWNIDDIQIWSSPVAPPVGPFVVVADADAVDQGIAIWDVTGHYETALGDGDLVLDLVHDAKGKITGTGTYSLLPDFAADPLALPVQITGKCRGKGGIVTLLLSIASTKESRRESGASFRAKMDLMLGFAQRQLVGTTTWKLTGSAGKRRGACPCILDLPADMDGTYTLTLDLDPDGATVTAAGTLTLANGTSFLLLGKGKSSSILTELRLRDDPLDPGARGILLRPGFVPFDGGNTILKSIVGKALGQKLSLRR